MSNAILFAADPATRAFPYYEDASLFFRLIARGRPYICPFQPVIDWVPAGSRLLDIGCGSGLWLVTLGTLGRIRSGVGCDTNQSALAIASKASDRLGRTHPQSKLTFLQTANIDEWPDETFDVVSMIDVMHHIPPHLQSGFLQAAWQRVRPGGRLIYKDMASSHRLYACANRLHDLLLARQIINYAPLIVIEAQLTASGGTVVHRGAWRRWLYAHELLVVDKCK